MPVRQPTCVVDITLQRCTIPSWGVRDQVSYSEPFTASFTAFKPLPRVRTFFNTSRPPHPIIHASTEGIRYLLRIRYNQVLHRLSDFDNVMENRRQGCVFNVFHELEQRRSCSAPLFLPWNLTRNAPFRVSTFKIQSESEA
jgi:hypothetical protein